VDAFSTPASEPVRRRLFCLDTHRFGSPLHQGIGVDRGFGEGIAASCPPQTLLGDKR